MSNKNEFNNHLNISEEDLFKLSSIEEVRSNAGLFKEKYNKYHHAILKKYGANALDFLEVTRYVRQEKIHLTPEMKEKYGQYDLKKAPTAHDIGALKMVFGLILFVAIGVFFYTSSDNKRQEITTPKGSTSKQSSAPCVGNQNCITEIRNLVQGSGSKVILSEQFEGNGIFQIQFMDYDRGGAYNATYKMDCNCKPLSVNASPLQ
jgi:hypothetical protein